MIIRRPLLLCRTPKSRRRRRCLFSPPLHRTAVGEERRVAGRPVHLVHALEAGGSRRPAGWRWWCRPCTQMSPKKLVEAGTGQAAWEPRSGLVRGRLGAGRVLPTCIIPPCPVLVPLPMERQAAAGLWTAASTAQAGRRRGWRRRRREACADGPGLDLVFLPRNPEAGRGDSRGTSSRPPGRRARARRTSSQRRTGVETPGLALQLGDARMVQPGRRLSVRLKSQIRGSEPRPAGKPAGSPRPAAGSPARTERPGGGGRGTHLTAAPAAAGPDSSSAAPESLNPITHLLDQDRRGRSWSRPRAAARRRGGGRVPHRRGGGGRAGHGAVGRRADALGPGHGSAAAGAAMLVRGPARLGRSERARSMHSRASSLPGLRRVDQARSPLNSCWFGARVRRKGSGSAGRLVTWSHPSTTAAPAPAPRTRPCSRS